MDTKTIMAALALLGNGGLLNGCEAAPKATRATPAVTPEAVVPPAPPESEAKEVDPEVEPAAPLPPARSPTEAKEVTPKIEPDASPRASRSRRTDAKEVTPIRPANPKEQHSSDAKGEMTCGEGKCGGGR